MTHERERFRVPSSEFRVNPKPETRNSKRRCGGQAIIEYAVLFGLVTAVLMGMQGYLKRGVQAGVKVAADQIGRQSKGLEDIDLKLDWKFKGDSAVVTKAASSKAVESRARGERVSRVDEQTTSSGFLSFNAGAESGQ